MENPVSTGDSYEAALLSAKEYYSNVAKGMGTRIATSDEIQPIEVTPGWDESFLQSKKDINVFEAESEPVGLSFRLFLPEAELAYGETGDERYLKSNTRFVFRTNKETGEQTMFYMTVLPDPEYVKNSGFDPYDDLTYISRPSDFTGLVLFHNEDGSYSNGWKYENGKVTQAVVIVDGANEFNAADDSDGTRTTVSSSKYYSYTTCYYTTSGGGKGSTNSYDQDEFVKNPQSKTGQKASETSFKTRTSVIDGDLGIECVTTGFTTYLYTDIGSNNTTPSNRETYDECSCGSDGVTGGYTGDTYDRLVDGSVASDGVGLTKDGVVQESTSVKNGMKTLTKVAALNKNIQYIKTATGNDGLEHGWLKMVFNFNTSNQYITYYEGKGSSKSIQYDTKIINQQNVYIVERFHAHPSGDMPILSYGDWSAIYSMIKNGQINPNCFYYGIASVNFGTLVMTITNYTLFCSFVKNNIVCPDKIEQAKNAAEKEYKRQQVAAAYSDNIGSLTSGTPYEHLIDFVQFLENAGVQLYFGDYEGLPWGAIDMMNPETKNPDISSKPVLQYLDIK